MAQYQKQHQQKGMMDKIKEKLPGMGHKNGPATTTHTTTATHGGTGQYQEKPGMMDKIKQKLPGAGQKTGPANTTHTTTATHGGTGQYQEKPHTTAPYGGTGQHHEKPGMVQGTGHTNDPYTTHSQTATTVPYGGTGYTEGRHEKKGVMDKIKEKLPGGRR